MADNKDYNVIDSAVIEIGFKLNKSQLMTDVSNAVKAAQDYVDKNPVKIDLQTTNGAKTAGRHPKSSAQKVLPEATGTEMYFDVSGLDKGEFRDVMGDMAAATIEARKITDARMRESLKLRQQELGLRKEMFEEQKARRDAGGMGGIGSVKGIAQFLGGSSAVAALAVAGVVSMVVRKSVDEIMARSTEISNKFITGQTAFVDRQTRGTMARFGLDPIAAQGLDRSMGLLGMTPEDMTLMTPGQQRAMGELMQQWFDGIENMGTDDLEAFSNMTQEFQMNISELRLQWELTKMDLLVTNRANIASLQRNLSNLFETIVDIASSEVVQQGLGMFISLITGIVNGISALMSALSSLLDIIARIPGFGGVNNTNNTTNNVTTNNISVASGLDIASGSLRN